MSDFTKGQWKLDTQDGYIRANGHPIAQVFGATVHNNEANTDECFANARLILNAPTMYEALTRIIPIIAGINIHEVLTYAVADAYKALEHINETEAANED